MRKVVLAALIPSLVLFGASCEDDVADAHLTGTDSGVQTCAQALCGSNATCSDSSGTPVCTCNSGFAGDGGTCTKIEDCSSAPCQNGGTCTNGASGYTCTCAAGFTGTNCETNVDDCTPNPCENGGTCTDSTNGYTCTCAAGFTGTTCQTNIDDCAPNPCQNGGVCTDGVNSYTCACANGYTGTTCDLPPTSCNAIKVANAAAPSGVYTVDLDGAGADAPFQVYCDMTTDGGGWTSVFKTSAGALSNAGALWTSVAPVNDAAADCSDPASAGANAYCVNLFVTKYWNANGITFGSARVHAYTAGAIVAFMKFGDVTANKTAWFSQANLTASSWTDLKTAPAVNYFSISGDGGARRNFFVNQLYAGCPGDVGWFVVSSSGGNKPCSWDTAAGTETRILYSNIATATNWNTSASVGAAETMMVFVK